MKNTSTQKNTVKQIITNNRIEPGSDLFNMAMNVLSDDVSYDKFVEAIKSNGEVKTTRNNTDTDESFIIKDKASAEANRADFRRSE